VVSEIISVLVILWCSLFADSKITDLLKRRVVKNYKLLKEQSPKEVAVTATINHTNLTVNYKSDPRSVLLIVVNTR